MTTLNAVSPSEQPALPVLDIDTTVFCLVMTIGMLTLAALGAN